MAVQTDIAVQDSMGHQGFDLVTGTALQSKGYVSIQVVSAAIFESVTGQAGSPVTGTWAMITIPAGTEIKSKIASFKLTSGQVLAYLAR
jgi:hypothetical protein